MKPSTDLTRILDIDKFATKTKKEVEFVVTRYNESLDWIRGLEHLVTVHNKGEPISLPCTMISVPNHGLGSETMLRHIIQNYDSLADMTMFCQGNLADRIDQPLYPLSWYFQGNIRGYLTTAYDPPTFKYNGRVSNESCRSKMNLGEFRKHIRIPYKYHGEFWVRGDWISVSRDIIRNKPKNYYSFLYDTCRFDRGVAVEELWFMERSWFSIFNRSLDKVL
jgi:hypothetical protein